MNNDLSSYFGDPEFKKLLAKYEGMVENHTPTYFDAEELTDIAEYYASQGKEMKADEVIDFALRLHPNNTDALIFKSRSLYIKGKLSEAYQVMNLIEDTSDREVKFLHADLLMEERRMEEAEAILQELAKSENESFEVLLDIVMNYLDANQGDYAAKWFDILREKGYNETNNQLFRDVWCDYCMTFGYLRKATEAFQLSLNEQPYSLPHWNGMAKCYLAQNMLEQAHEAIDFSLAIDENNSEALEIKGFCHMQNENYEEAIAIFKRLLPEHPNSNRIYPSLIKCYLEMEKPGEAKNTCLEWLKQCPQLSKFEKTEIYNFIAMCCFNLNQPVEGMKYIDAALDWEPGFRGAILQKGMLHVQLKENNEAQQLFQKAIDISPDDEQSEIIYRIANGYFFLRLYPETIEWCQKIVQNYPDVQMEALYMIACSYYSMSDMESCLEYLAIIFGKSNYRFEDEYLNDVRFKHMFDNISLYINQNKQQE